MLNDIEVLYIIYETEFNKTTYRIIQHSSGKIRDVGFDYISMYHMDLSKAQHIIVKSIKSYTGRLKTGLNDFETYCRLNDLTKLLSEYDTRKNIKPANAIAKGCIDKVWWVCSNCGYEWQAIIKSRTGMGAGCPMCKHKIGKYHILVQGDNDLETWCKINNREDILIEYSGDNELKPNEISAKGHNKVKWICSRCKKEFEQIVGNRTDKNQGCPYCNKNGTSFPERFIFEFISACGIKAEYRYKLNGVEVDIYIPSLKKVIDYRGKYWHTDREEIDAYKESVISSIGVEQIIIIGDRQLKTNSVDDKVIQFDEKDYYWLSRVLAKIVNVNNDKMSNEKIDEVMNIVTVKQNNKEVVNSLEVTHPQVAALWDYERNGDFKPNSITYGTKYKAWFICNKCGRSHYSFIRKQVQGQGCPYCNINKKISSAYIINQEKQNDNKCNTSLMSNTTNNKHKAQYLVFKQEIISLLNGKKVETDTEEFDIYLPELNLAINYVDTQYNDKKYLQNKSLKFISKGIQIINIFEYEWADSDKKRKLIEYIKAFVQSNKVLYGRKLSVQYIDDIEASQFCNKYHLQGSASGSISIGLKDGNELVSVMTFRAPRFDHNYQLEIIRYCNKAGVSVVGGAEKMFKYLIENNKPKSIMTYADIAKFTGKVYGKLGFKSIGNGVTTPNYVWVDSNLKAIPRYKTQKQKLINAGLGRKEQTEDEIMVSLGYRKVYDCGNLKMEWINEQA